MKNLLIALASMVGIVAYGQSYGVVTPSLGTQTSIASSQTSNNIVVIDCKKAKEVGVQVSFKLSGAGTGAQVLTFAKSVDGSYTTADTLAAGLQTWTIAANGTATTAAAVVATTTATTASGEQMNLGALDSATRAATKATMQWSM